MHSSYPLALLLTHTALLLAVAITDLARRRVYQLWTVTALVLALVSLWFAPYPWLNVFTGLLFFSSHTYAWYRGQQRLEIAPDYTPLGGGDVWVGTYLGLLFGLAVAPPLILAVLLLLGALAAGLLRWRGTAPAAGIWALGALLWLALAEILGVDPFGGGLTFTF